MSILQSPATWRVDVLLIAVALRTSVETSAILFEVYVGRSQSLHANAHEEATRFQNHFKTFPVLSFTCLLTTRLCVLTHWQRRKTSQKEFPVFWYLLETFCWRKVEADYVKKTPGIFKLVRDSITYIIVFKFSSRTRNVSTIILSFYTWHPVHNSLTVLTARPFLSCNKPVPCGEHAMLVRR